PLEDDARRAAARAVRRRIPWETGRDDERPVVRAGARPAVGVLVGAPDRGLRTPRAIEVLRLEHGDVYVAERHVHDGQRARRLRDVVVAGGRRARRDTTV